MRTIQKPQEGEYPAYASMYIDLLPDDGMVLQNMEENMRIKIFPESLCKAKYYHHYLYVKSLAENL